ncbi:MAG: hypothetical protein JHC33_11480 [Ignisphaera sp.]|nr:hypothetical protein [Ignisphaera sp.]
MQVTFKGFNSKVALQRIEVGERPYYALLVNGTVVDVFETKQEGINAFNKLIANLS